MTENGTYGIQSYQGSVERPKPIQEHGPSGPMHLHVTVTTLNFKGYDHAQYEIRVSWTGPVKLPGTPDITNQSGITTATDVHMTDDPELARALFAKVIETYPVALAAGEVGLLKHLAADIVKHTK